MKNNTQGYLFLGASAVLIFVAFSSLSEVPSLLEVNGISKQTNPSFINKSMSVITDALQLQPLVEQFTYTNTFESPYRKKNALGNHNSIKTVKNAGPIRPKLFLKGVLMKNDALAIIEDERGGTYIRGIGDTIVEQQTIVSIKENHVILRDRQGSYELAVEER
jgi:type II secretory pathway component PulC